MKTVGEQWNSFYRDVLHPINPSETQIIEIRRAFYAGAVAMLALVSQAAPNEDAGAAELETLSRELAAYQKTVGTTAERGRP